MTSQLAVPPRSLEQWIADARAELKALRLDDPLRARLVRMIRNGEDELEARK